MIIKGGAAGNVGWWGNHLQREDTNDRAEVMEISGLLSTNLDEALREMKAIAAQSRSRGNFMYQANINPEVGEVLTEQQWREAIDTLENHMGLSRHQRVVVEHEKEGRVHRHVVWNRVDVDTLRVTDIGGNYYTHERVSRTLELKFDLQRTASLHGERNPEGRPDRPGELWEKRAAEKTGIDAKQIKAEITDLWRKTDSGKAFAAAVTERGYILAQGDRRSFCIVDQAGTAHSLARRIEGANSKDIRERFADIDTGKLLKVVEAQTTQDEKYPTRDAARTAWETRAGAAASQAPAQEQTYPQAPHRPDTHPPKQEKAMPEEPKRTATDSQAQPREAWHSRAATRMEERIFRVQDAAERGGVQVAAGLHSEGITLARVDAAGKDGIQLDYQRKFDEAWEAGKDDARLRRAAFAEGELVAVTRYGDVHRLNPKYIDTAQLERAATGDGKQAPSLSTALEFFATNRVAGRDAPQPQQVTPKEQTYPQEPHRPGTQPPQQEQTKPREQERPATEPPQTPREVWHPRAATKLEERIFGIQDIADRGGVHVAAGLYNQGITLARVDEAGKVQHAYDRRFDPRPDVGNREVHLLSDTFKAGDLVAVTRDGDVERINPRFIDVQRLEQSACGNLPAPPLSTALEFFATDRAADRTEKENTASEFLDKKQQGQEFREAAREVTDEARATQREHRETVQDIKGAAFTVTDAATGAVSTLSSFIEKLMSLGTGGPPLTEGDMIVRQRRAAAAIESIDDSFERGDSLSSSDLQHLTPTHLDNLFRGGDAYMRELLDGIKRDQEREERENDHGRSREY